MQGTGRLSWELRNVGQGGWSINRLGKDTTMLKALDTMRCPSVDGKEELATAYDERFIIRILEMLSYFLM